MEIGGGFPLNAVADYATGYRKPAGPGEDLWTLIEAARRDL